MKKFLSHNIGYKILLVLLLAAFTGGCEINQKEEKPEPECKAEVSGQIIIHKSSSSEFDDQYSIRLDIKNIGDLKLFSVSIPFKVLFTDGSHSEGSVIGYADLDPLESADYVTGYILGAEVGGVWKSFKGEINSLKMGEPKSSCQHY